MPDLPTPGELSRQKLEWEVREQEAAYYENRDKARRERRSWWLAPIPWSIPIAVGIVTTILTLHSQQQSDRYKELQDSYVAAKRDLVGSVPGVRAAAATALVDIARRLNDPRATDEAKELLEAQLLTETDINVLNNLITTVGSEIDSPGDLLAENLDAARAFFAEYGKLVALLSIQETRRESEPWFDPAVTGLLFSARIPRESDRFVSEDSYLLFLERGSYFEKTSFEAQQSRNLTLQQARSLLPEQMHIVVQEFVHLVATGEAICDVLRRTQNPTSHFGLSLVGAYIIQGDLKNTYLKGVDFREAYLGADLTGADLSYANLNFADLRPATMERAFIAPLRQTRIEGASVLGARLPNLREQEDQRLKSVNLSEGYYEPPRPDFYGTPWWTVSPDPTDPFQPTYGTTYGGYTFKTWELRYPIGTARSACATLRSAHRLSTEGCSLPSRRLY